jgi:hypothetical protein
MNNSIPHEIIENQIYLIRGQKVMLDFHLANLYGVPTKTLNQAVKRNHQRFPEDFMFQLTWEETKLLRSQFVTLKANKNKRGQHIKYLPYAFTEQGIAMLSSVLRSERAIQVNITIMRIFVRIKQLLSSHKEILTKLNELEQRTDNNTVNIQLIFETIRKMLAVEEKPKKRIGFIT